LKREPRIAITAETIVPITASTMMTPTTVWKVGVFIQRRIWLP
jgi:hypothetical protein